MDKTSFMKTRKVKQSCWYILYVNSKVYHKNLIIIYDFHILSLIVEINFVIFFLWSLVNNSFLKKKIVSS